MGGENHSKKNGDAILANLDELLRPEREELDRLIQLALDFPPEPEDPFD